MLILDRKVHLVYLITGQIVMNTEMLYEMPYVDDVYCFSRHLYVNFSEFLQTTAQIPENTEI